MKTTIFMAISADGFVARADGSEDFLPHDGWLDLVAFSKKYGHLIWGRRTYESVRSWGDDFMNDIADVPIIVVSRDMQHTYPKNVTICSSPAEALSCVNEMGLSGAFIAGGPTLNTSFVKEGFVDEIILNYNPIIISDGIKLFSKDDLELTLNCKEVIEKPSGIVQIRYALISKGN